MDASFVSRSNGVRFFADEAYPFSHILAFLPPQAVARGIADARQRFPSARKVYGGAAQHGHACSTLATSAPAG
ncbi:MAG: hypothetical protein KatS3mg111_4198 [Pirellulaceae bacterium]|nr:MAG: hypothetical protein KatS3mg111_4198 [Pirellulaceae bacterium]